jgi:hypothetical protein
LTAARQNVDVGRRDVEPAGADALNGVDDEVRTVRATGAPDRLEIYPVSGREAHP